MWKNPLDSIVLTLFFAAGLRGQTPDPPTALSWTDRTIESLRQVSGELNEAVKSFYTSGSGNRAAAIVVIVRKTASSSRQPIPI